MIHTGLRGSSQFTVLDNFHCNWYSRLLGNVRNREAGSDLSNHELFFTNFFLAFTNKFPLESHQNLIRNLTLTKRNTRSLNFIQICTNKSIIYWFVLKTTFLNSRVAMNREKCLLGKPHIGATH